MEWFVGQLDVQQTHRWKLINPLGKLPNGKNYYKDRIYLLAEFPGLGYPGVNLVFRSAFTPGDNYQGVTVINNKCIQPSGVFPKGKMKGGN